MLTQAEDRIIFVAIVLGQCVERSYSEYSWIAAYYSIASIIQNNLDQGSSVNQTVQINMHENNVTDRPWVYQITVFIDTTHTIIEAVMNTEHFKRILRITLNRQVCSCTSSSLGSWPWCCSNPVPHTHRTTQFHLHSVVEHSLDASPLHHTFYGLWAQESLAIRSSHREIVPSPSAGRLLYHHDETPPLSATCSLYHHEKTPPPSTVLSLCLREETPSLPAHCLAMGRLHCHLLFSHCVSVRRLPVNLWMLSSIALSHFSIIWLCHSYSSGNVWYTRMFYLFLTRECSSGLSL
jgi:hypothetical protein